MPLSQMQGGPKKPKKNQGGHDGSGGDQQQSHEQQGKGSSAAIYDPTATQTGKDLKKLAQAMTKMEIRPQVQAYKRLAQELRLQETADTAGLARLGESASANIQSAYETLGLTSPPQTPGVPSNEPTTKMGVKPGVTPIGQQPPSVEAMLSAGGGEYGNVLALQQASTRQQGAASQADLQKAIASRIAQTQLESGADIRETLGKKADVKATKGATMLAKLMEARESERSFILGKRATRADKAAAATDAALQREGMAADQAQAAAALAHDDAEREDTQSFQAAQAAQAQAAAAALNDADNQAAAQGDNADAAQNAQQQQKERARQRKDIAALARQQLAAAGAPDGPKGTAKLESYIRNELGSTVPSSLIHKIVRQILANR